MMPVRVLAAVRIGGPPDDAEDVVAAIDLSDAVRYFNADAQTRSGLDDVAQLWLNQVRRTRSNFALRATPGEFEEARQAILTDVQQYITWSTYRSTPSRAVAPLSIPLIESSDVRRKIFERGCAIIEALQAYVAARRASDQSKRASSVLADATRQDEEGR